MFHENRDLFLIAKKLKKRKMNVLKINKTLSVGPNDSDIDLKKKKKQKQKFFSLTSLNELKAI